MSLKTQQHITGRLSLRPPQSQSLAVLKQALDTAPEVLARERDVSLILQKLQEKFPTLQDFEREFPSLCFALATGVGKTRLMGAFIAYLYLAHGINNFFVLAPNLTIYNKLIADFTPNTPKYVFKGISEFAINAPKVITGDNYDQQSLSMGMGNLFGEIVINVFNISKINSEVRGGKEPRIKRMREVLGDSYFNYLANLPDLVLLMDESHPYRALAGMRAINELNPLLGLELTATPFVESTRAPIPFKNVVVDYPLAKALDDGFIKTPAVVTQRNFNAKNYTPEEIEKIKLEDGVRLHENTKVELQTYARQHELPFVKPFMLVIARDTTHASQLLALLESSEFYAGRYAGKVIQVDSSKSGKDEEKMINRLLAVESVDEPTEIVIHVNMLKEGWDVTNLYTIVPLRAANARTLIEQSIGRGLRLPYGKRTGVDVVDRLNIVAHDRFQEIIDEANKGDSVLKLQQMILDAPDKSEHKVSVQVPSNIDVMLGLSDASDKAPDNVSIGALNDNVPTSQTVFQNDREKLIARTALQTASRYANKPSEVPTSKDLMNENVQQKIMAEVRQALAPVQGNLLIDDVEIKAITAQVAKLLINNTIDIPRITVVPSGEISSGFHAFRLDTAGLHLQPSKREILIHDLHTDEQSSLSAELGLKEKRAEDYIVHALVDFDDIDYFTQAELLYDLAGQMVGHLRGYLSENEVLNVLDTNRRLIAREIHAQMQTHFWEKATEYEVKVSQGFTPLKPCQYTATEDKVHKVRETVQDVSRIRQMLFGGFQKCLYPLQKFDSDTERRFAIILEREAQKWFKPTEGQFQIYYKLGAEQKEYVPDFVVETANHILMVETKALNDMNDDVVLTKATAGVAWCKQATQYTKAHDGKAWCYLLIPHNEVLESKKLIDFLQFERK